MAVFSSIHFSVSSGVGSADSRPDSRSVYLLVTVVSIGTPEDRKPGRLNTQEKEDGFVLGLAAYCILLDQYNPLSLGGQRLRVFHGGTEKKPNEVKRRPRNQKRN